MVNHTEIEFNGSRGHRGIVIGLLDPFVHKSGAGSGPRQNIHPETEWSRVEIAFAAAAGEMEQKIRRLALEVENGSAGPREIFQSHVLILHDLEFRNKVKERIHSKKCSGAEAIDDAVDEYITMFQSRENQVFSSKALDMNDIRWSLHYHLEAMSRKSDLSGHIVWAPSLTPHQVFELKEKRVAAIAVQNSSASSHDMILAEALKIPTLYNIDMPLQYADGKTLAILDGETGKLIVAPGKETLARYRKKIHEASEISIGMANRKLKEELETVEGGHTTGCGQRVELFANLEFADELQVLPKEKINGIGLCRTEFLFQDIFRCDEAKQTGIYSSIVRYFQGKAVVFRLFDISPEKTPHLSAREGLFSIRYLLANREVLKTQINALLSSVDAERATLKILLPMVTLWEELDEVTNLIEESATRRNIPRPDIGVMIETPAAIDLMKTMNGQVDFYSVGTNDLLQFLTVTKRSMAAHRHIYDPLHETMLSSLERIHELAGSRPVTICGEIAGNPLYLPLQLALGFRSFSVPPPRLLDSALAIRRTNLEQARSLLDALRNIKSISERRTFLTSQAGKTEK